MDLEPEEPEARPGGGVEQTAEFTTTAAETVEATKEAASMKDSEGATPAARTQGEARSASGTAHLTRGQPVPTSESKGMVLKGK